MLPFLISTWYMDIDHLIVARWCPSSSVSRHLVHTASSKVTVTGWWFIVKQMVGRYRKNVGNIHVGFVLSIFDDHSQFINCMVFDSFWAIEQIFGSVRCYLPMTVTPLYPDHRHGLTQGICCPDSSLVSIGSQLKHWCQLLLDQNWLGVSHIDCLAKLLEVIGWENWYMVFGDIKKKQTMNFYGLRVLHGSTDVNRPWLNVKYAICQTIPLLFINLVSTYL